MADASSSPSPQHRVAGLGRHDVVWAAAGHANTVFATSYDELVALTHGTAADVGA